MKNIKLISFIVAAALLCTLPASIFAKSSKFSFTVNLDALPPPPPPVIEEHIYIPCPPPYFERPIVIREYYCNCCGRMEYYQPMMRSYPPPYSDGYYAHYPMTGSFVHPQTW